MSEECVFLVAESERLLEWIQSCSLFQDAEADDYVDDMLGDELEEEMDPAEYDDQV